MNKAVMFLCFPENLQKIIRVALSTIQYWIQIFGVQINLTGHENSFSLLMQEIQLYMLSIILHSYKQNGSLENAT
jgi:hypothetical protein